MLPFLYDIIITSSCICRLNKKGRYTGHFSQFQDSPEDNPDIDQSPPHSSAMRGPGHVTILTRTSNQRRDENVSKSKSDSSINPSAGSTHKGLSRKTQSSEGHGPKGHGSKGRGGDVKTVDGDRARQLKEKSKGKRGNHNRKAMADRKRGRGMGALPRQ